MKVCHMMIYLLVLTLQDGNIGLINAEISIFTRTEGESITVKCDFTDTGRRTYFCKDECKDKDILVETNEVKAQRGRYSIENKNTTQGTRLHVTITQLTKSDSGLYRCGLEKRFLFDPYWEFKIIVTDEISIFTKTEGENITVICPFTNTGRRTYFCKDECKDKDILVKTNEVKAQRGRYSIENKNTPQGTRLHVTITQLTKSDSGLYRCGLEKRFFFDPYVEFKIIVRDAPSISKSNLTLRPFITSVQPASTPTATTPRRSFTPSSSSTETTNQPEEQQTETPTAGGSGVLLYVRLTLFIMLILISVPALILWKKRATKPKEYPVETVYADDTEATQVYDEIREDDRQSRSPPVQISSIYTVRYTKPSDDNSFITATAPCHLNKTEDDSSELTYSQVHDSNGATASLSSAPRGHADNTVYSAPRIHTEASTDDRDNSQPLYSNVTLPLQDGNISLINAEISIFTRTEGESITVPCDFTDTGRRTYFCKDECEDKDILVETNEVRAQRGRYSIENKNTTQGPRLYVTITQLTKSDSGLYGCGLDKRFFFDLYVEFKIIVTDAPSTSKPNLTLRPFITSVQPASTPTATTPRRSFTPSSSSTETTNQPEMFSSPSISKPNLTLRPFITSVQPASTPTATTPRRSFTPSSSSTETTNQPEEQQTETPTAGGSGVLLYVRLTLFIMLILISVPALILWKKRATKPKEYPVETVYADDTEATQVYDEIREDDRQSRSPPVQISTIYTVRYTKPSDDNSFITATAPCQLNKTEDDSSELTYSQVHVSNGATASLSSAPRGHADNTVYSAPRIHTDASTDDRDNSQPLYSNVTLRQQ
ncbi:hypothetical protein PAMP_012572 [Pampus punctatissimus]